MLRLRTVPASPFGRQVLIAAALLGIGDRIAVVVTDTADPDSGLREENPLGKIPTLLLDSGEALYDSRVIVEYIDQLAGGGLFPSGAARFAALRDQALANGICDATALQVYEVRWRAQDMREPKWVAHQADKVARSLAHAEAHLSVPPPTFHVGHIALACALGYLDLRMEGRWRREYPCLAAWLDDFGRRVPAFAQTQALG